MSYQVIARKYRPLTLDDLTGQETISRTLKYALDNDRIHHAYLFSGVRGTGKTTTARILAKGLNCHKGITSNPCGECASCLEITSGTAIDVLEIDAASNTGIDDIRQVIINNISMVPARDRYKVFIIDEVHQLSKAAFNALLKTLEEPPSHVVFIMATTELHKVPDTILSRCQQFEFKQIPSKQIQKRLREISDNEGIKIDDAALMEITRAGAGSMRDAQSALDQVIAFGGMEPNKTITVEEAASALGLVSSATIINTIQAITEQDSTKLLDIADDIVSRGYDLRTFARELMSYMRHMLVLKSGLNNSEILDIADTEISRLKEYTESFSEEDIVRFFNLLGEIEKNIKDSYHARFELEMGLVKLAHMTRLRSLNEIINRLESLETRLSSRLSGGAASIAPPSSTAGTQSPRASDSIRQGAMPRSTESAPVMSSIQNTTNSSAQHAAQPVISDPVSAITHALQTAGKMRMVVALEDAQQVNYRDGLLTIIFGSEDQNFKAVQNNVSVIQATAQMLFNTTVQINLRTSGKVTEKPVDEAELKKKDQHDKAMMNPAVKLVIEQTRGKITRIVES